MKDILNEQLSALIDDELGEAEHPLLLRQLARDAELRDRLGRYQLISDALHSNLPHRVDTAFCQRVHAALAAEAELHASPSRFRQLVRPAAGMALAASVAVVAVMSLQSLRQAGPADTPVVASAPSVNDYIRATDTPLSVAQHNSARGLDVYLVNHNEYAVNRGMQGMLPYVRIVGQDLQPDTNDDAGR
ncbi:MAG: sigma-E factor negative regulatory protein [Pseudomonadota bacterium]